MGPDELHPIEVVIEGLLEQTSPDPAHQPSGFRERLTLTLKRRP